MLKGTVSDKELKATILYADKLRRVYLTYLKSEKRTTIFIFT